MKDRKKALPEAFLKGIPAQPAFKAATGSPGALNPFTESGGIKADCCFDGRRASDWLAKESLNGIKQRGPEKGEEDVADR